MAVRTLEKLLPLKRPVQFPRLVIIVLFFSLLQYLFFNSTAVLDSLNRNVLKSRRNLQVAIINTPLSHDEVLVPLLDAWRQVPRVEITTYLTSWRFDMERVIVESGFPPEWNEPIYAGEFKKLGQDPQYPIPDVVVSTTCLKDWQMMNESMYYLLENHHTHFFCLFHHADHMENKGGNANAIDQLTPFLRADRIDFIALSNHVAEFALNEQFGRKWDVFKDELHHPPVHVFPPVFEMQFSEESQNNKQDRTGGFSLQGEYEKGRDYKMVFEHLQRFIGAAQERNESTDATNLHLVGFGEHPEVPQDLQSHVIFDERLDYTDFYTTLMQSDAVLTAFAIEDYYTTKASSSIPAALIAGVPLVCDYRLLHAYRYLDESICWMQVEGESEMDVIGRVLAMSREEKDRKKEVVKAFTKGLVRENHKHVREWMAKAIEKFPLDWDLE